MAISFDVTNIALGTPATRADVQRYFSHLPNGSIAEAPTSTRYVLNNLTDSISGQFLQFEFIGTGFTFDVNGFPISGTVTELNIKAGAKIGTSIVGAQTVVEIDGISWNAAALINAVVTNNTAAFNQIVYGQDSFNYSGGNFNDTFTGSFFGDTLNGEDGNDTIFGDGGSDEFIGSAGADTMDGGAHDSGGDSVNYSGITNPAEAVKIALGAANANAANTSTAGSIAAGDVIRNIENIFAGAGNDVLTGNDLNNVFTGLDGNDTLSGGKGADTLYGGQGDDTLVGGADGDVLDGGFSGTDTVSYATSSTGVTIDLSLNDNGNVNNSGTQKGGDAEGDQLANIDIVIGSANKDTIKGSSADETFVGGAGADSFDGNGGIDTVSYASLSAAIVINLNANSATGGDALGDTFANIDNLIGGKGADVLTGDSSKNVIYGGDGNDIIEGGADADELVGGGGATPGIDTISYASSSGGVQVNLALQGNVLSNGEKDAPGTAQTGGDAQGDLLWGFENIIGSAEADSLRGNSGNNVINGGGGHDYLVGDAGVDTLDGGADSDVVDYYNITNPAQAVIITLGGANAIATNTSTSGSIAAGDILKNIENIYGGAGNDKLTGNDFDNTFLGEDGDDTLSGGKGGDWLSGANNNDVLIGGGGADNLDGGAGIDTANYAASAFSVTIDLSLNDNNNISNSLEQKNGDAEGDKLSSIEIVIGSAKNDIIKGSSEDETFIGGVGADAFDGNGGVDTVSFAGLAAAVIVNLTAGTGTGGDAQGDTFANIDNLIGGNGADVLTGDSEKNFIYGANGNDIIDGGSNADELVGGLGIDTLSYANSTGTVIVDLSTQGTSLVNGEKNAAGATQNSGEADGDLIWGFENLTGGKNGDILFGDGGANVINGGDGNDHIKGAGANDTLDGGAGIDTLDYSYLTGTQHLTLTLGAYDAKTLNAAKTNSSGVAGDIDSVQNFERVIGGAGNDKLTGNAGDNWLTGGDGADILIGGAGADRLHGNITTSVDLGNPGDTADYSASNAGVTLTISNASYSGPGKGGHAEGDILAGINNIIGSNFNDFLSGGTVAGVLSGLGGDDIIRAANHSAGTNILDGGANGAGGDTLDYSWAGSGTQLTITLSSTNNAVTAVTSNNLAATNIKNFENIIGGAGDDILTGNNVANVIEGGAGEDTLTGIGTGDTVSYAGSLSGVFVDLTITTAQEAMYDFGAGSVANGAAGDKLQNLPNFVGSNSNDVVQGSAVANNIKGFGGDDDLSGGEGNVADILDGGDDNDNLFGGGGGDTLKGGLGLDTIAYQTGSETAGVTITLGKDGAQTTGSGGDAAGDLISGVENIFGSNFAHATTGAGDKLTGNNLANELYGNSGNDILDGAAANDVLVGGDDNDTLTGGTEADILDGRNGNDTISYALSATGVTVNLTAQGTYVGGDPTKDRDTTGAIQTGGDALGDTLWGVENIIGSAKNDVLTAFNGTQFLDGGAGDDVIVAADGEALLGGAGNDTLSFAAKITSVTASLTNQGTANATRTGVNGPEIVDSYRAAEFENLIGGSGDDELAGNASANIIEGGAGKDTLTGGGGLDTLSYAGSANGVTVSLNGPTGEALIFNVSGDAFGDKATGFINLLGSAANDSLQGDTRDNVINGGAGKDSILGHAGADTLFGGAGEDTFDGGLGADKIDGGTSGSDRDEVSYIAVTDNITLTLGANGAAATVSSKAGNVAAGDTLTNIERVYAGDGNDALTGNNLDHDLRGDDGNDTLAGGTGSSFLYGENGDDIIFASISNGGKGGDVGTETYSGGADNDTLNLSKLTTGVTIDLAGDIANYIPGTDDVFLFEFESIIGTNKDDNLRGNFGPATKVDGGAGNDIIEGGQTADTLIGGTGIDTLSYAHSDVAGVLITLKAGQAADIGPGSGHSAGDVATGFENLIGSDFSDTLIGDTGNNVIEGGYSVDLLIGGLGNDTVSYAGSTGGVTVDLGKQGATLADGVTIDGTKLATPQGDGDLLYNFENIMGSAEADFLFGDGGNNTIDGGAGVDELHGFAGQDTLRGGAGDDQFIAGGADGAGADTYDGGADFDAVRYTAETVGITVVLGTNGTSANVTGGAGATGDKLISIERVIGGSGADTFTGNNLKHTLEGRSGNDTLIGSTGDSTLLGGLGDDKLVASIGANEVYDGGDDIDTLSFAGFGVNTTVTVNLATGTHSATGITNLTISNLENLIGGAGNDSLTGNGNDAATINGGAGNDTIKGGTAVDTFTGGAGNDTFVFVDANQGKDVFTDFANLDKLQIDKAAFAGGLELLASGALTDASYLVVGAGAVANNGSHGQFVYNTTNDTLYWDDDGVAGGAVEIGQFGSSVVLKLADFTLI